MADPIVVNINGVGKVNFPAEFTPDQIKFAIENDILPRMKGQSAAAADTAKFESQIKKDAAPTKLERFGRGFADITQGITQGALRIDDLISPKDAPYRPQEGAADAYTKEKTEELDRYERNRGPDAGVDLMRLGGNVVATAPIAALVPGSTAAALGTRVAAGAGQGALTGAAMFTPEGHSKAEQIAIGGLVGGAVPAVAEGVRRVASPAVSKISDVLRGPQSVPQRLEGEISIKLQQQGIDWNKLTQQAKDSLLADAKKALETGGTLDDAMLANKATIEAVGAKGTKAAITRAPRDWQAQQNMRGVEGVGDDIVRRQQSDAQAMVDYLGKLRGQAGGKASTAYEAGESAIGALRSADTAKKQAVDDLYNAFRAHGAQDVAIPDTKLAATLGRVADEIGSENIPGPVMKRLQEFGLMGGDRTKLLTVNEADKLSRLINNNNPGRGTPGAKALQPIKDALDDALLEVDTKGAGQALMTAREAAAKRFAEQRSAKGITAAIEDVAPDRFVKKFIVDADVRDLRGTLGELKKSAAGSDAIRDIKGHVLDNLLLKATGATATDDVAGRAFSGVKFGKALDSIAPEKLHQLFTPDEMTALRTLQKASKLLTEEVPFSDVNHSKTASALANLFLKIGNTPLLGQLASPIIGTAKIGMDWVKNAETRKQVAEALLASAAKEGAPKRLPVYAAEKFLPAVGAAAAQAGAQ